MTTFKTLFAEETKKRAFDFGREILARGPGEERATVVAFSGELGAGKTTFIQGMARGLGVKRRIQSPTFIFIRRFGLKKSDFENFFHIDAYRIKEGDRADFLDLEKIFKNPKNIVAVEWPQKISRQFLKGALRISIKHGKDTRERMITIDDQ